MVGAPPRLTLAAVRRTCRASTALLAACVPAALVAFMPAVLAATPAYSVSGSCRDARPHGAYEVHMPDGRLRVAGAFNQGKRIGTFLFWSATGIRVALLPFDDDVMSGTVALWYPAASAKTEPARKLEAVYVGGRPVSATSWYPDGRLRTEIRYDRDGPADARAWSTSGKPLPDAQARALAARDLAADAKFYDSLLALVRDNPPACETNERKS